MKKLIIILTLLSTPAFAGCGSWEKSHLRPIDYCSGTYVQMCIGGQWQWVCM